SGCSTTDRALEIIEGHFKDTKFNHLEIEYILSNYNYSKHEVKNIDCRISFEFDDYKYIINRNLSNFTTLIKLYHQQLTKEEIEIIVLESSQQFLKQLEEQIEIK
ncbi:MAG: hypothetical protein K2X86_03655, partial [Cytophagaceae bacterium]|nr:hypothetical protein [Cytophagaceae bacterium]